MDSKKNIQSEICASLKRASAKRLREDTPVHHAKRRSLDGQKYIEIYPTKRREPLFNKIVRDVEMHRMRAHPIIESLQRGTTCDVLGRMIRGPIANPALSNILSIALLNKATPDVLRFLLVRKCVCDTHIFSNTVLGHLSKKHFDVLRPYILSFPKEFFHRIVRYAKQSVILSAIPFFVARQIDMFWAIRMVCLRGFLDAFDLLYPLREWTLKQRQSMMIFATRGNPLQMNIHVSEKTGVKDCSWYAVLRSGVRDIIDVIKQRMKQEIQWKDLPMVALSGSVEAVDYVLKSCTDRLSTKTEVEKFLGISVRGAIHADSPVCMYRILNLMTQKGYRTEPILDLALHAIRNNAREVFEELYGLDPIEGCLAMAKEAIAYGATDILSFLCRVGSTYLHGSIRSLVALSLKQKNPYAFLILLGSGLPISNFTGLRRPVWNISRFKTMVYDPTRKISTNLSARVLMWLSGT